MTDQVRPAPLQITPQTILSRRDETLLTPLDDGLGIILNIADGRVFNVNTVGRRVWELLEAPRTLADLCAAIGGEFRVDPATCQAAVAKFVGQVAHNGLIRAE